MPGTSIGTWIRRRPAYDRCFLLFSHGWTWLWWGVNVAASYDAFGRGLPFTVLGGVGPLLGGVVMTYVTYGTVGFTDLRDRLTNWKRVRVHWAIVTVVFFPAIVVATALLAGIVVGSPFPLETSFDELIRQPVTSS